VQSSSGNLEFEKARYWIVVTDVLRAPWGSKGSFINRWKWLVHIYDTCKPSYVKDGVMVDCWPFVLQEWTRLDSPRAFELVAGADEGIVLQSLTAPSGAMKHGLGSARYVKRRYTVDRKHNGKIFEFDAFTNELIRERTDKQVANSNAVMKAVRSAVSYDVFRSYLFYIVVGAMGANSKRITHNLVTRVAISEWNHSDLLWVYKNRYQKTFNALFPGLSRYFDDVVAPFMIQCGKEPVEEIRGDEEEACSFADPDDDDAPVEDYRVPDVVPSVAPVPMLYAEVSKFIDTEEWDLTLEHLVDHRVKKGIEKTWADIMDEED